MNIFQLKQIKIYQNIYVLILLVGLFLFYFPVQSQHSLTKILAEKTKIELDNSFYEAVKQEQLSNIDEAIVQYYHCLELDPNHHASMYNLAVIYKEKGDYRQAILLLEKAITLEKKNIWYYNELAGLYKSIRNYASASKIYETLNILDPTNEQHLFNAAKMYEFGGNKKKAIKIYNQIEKVKGVSENTTLAKENIYIIQKNYHEAIKCMIKLANAFPTEMRYQGMLADLYQETGKETEALKIYYHIIEIEPNNGLAHMALYEYYKYKSMDDSSLVHLKIAFEKSDINSKQKVETLLNLLQKSKSNILIKNSIEELIGILKKNEPNEQSVFIIASRYYQTIENWKQARTELETALEINPGIQNAYADIIEIDLKLKDNQKVIEHANKAVQYFPNASGFYLYNAQANYKLSNYEEAIKQARLGIETAPIDRNLNILLYTIIGDASYYIKNYKSSDSAFAEVLNIDPENYYTLNNWAYYLALRNEQLAKAEAMAKTIIERFPDNLNYLDTYGFILYKTKKYEQAEIVLKKAASSNENAEILEHYGDVLYKLGKKDEAMKIWKKAQSLNSSNWGLNNKINTGKLAE